MTLAAWTDVRISLMQFASFLMKPPEQQFAVVREVRRQHATDYKVAPDLYKQFRESIATFHQDGRSREFLSRVVADQTEASRMKHYPLLLQGYLKFLGRKSVEWFDPPAGVWRSEDLNVNVRPELGLAIGGRSHAHQALAARREKLEQTSSGGDLSFDGERDFIISTQSTNVCARRSQGVSVLSR